MFELERFSLAQQRQLRFHREALDRYLSFARTGEALWRGNFRDLSASLIRMATLTEGSRITLDNVEDEILRLKRLWSIEQPLSDLLTHVLGAEALAQIDEFDRFQLSGVVEVCQKSKSMADAGRQLFSASRAQKATSNDSDRLRKYLTRFGLSWESVKPS